MNQKFIIFLLFIIFIIYVASSLNDYNNEQFVYNKLNYNNPEKKLDPDTHYIFWTGGFDSTFRICKLLHDVTFKKTITPLYIVDPYVDGMTGRENKLKEIDTMNKLRKKINNRFPKSKSQLRPTIYFNNIDYDYKKEYIDKCMNKLVKIGCASRMYTQYRTIAIITLQNDIVAEVGTEGKEKGSITKYLLPYLKNGYIFKDSSPKHFDLFKNIRWPLSMYKKQDMLYEAEKNGYSKILYHTFSCWFPINDKPCGKCNMCTERLKDV
jgi:hypothetical protein